MVQMAVLHELVIIGEAANKLSDDLKAQYPEIPWRDIVDFRNVLAHHYWGNSNADCPVHSTKQGCASVSLKTEFKKSKDP